MRLNDVNSLSTNCNWVMMMCRKESYVRLVQVSYRLLYQKETSFKAREGATKGDFIKKPASKRGKGQRKGILWAIVRNRFIKI